MNYIILVSKFLSLFWFPCKSNHIGLDIRVHNVLDCIMFSFSTSHFSNQRDNIQINYCDIKVCVKSLRGRTWILCDEFPTRKSIPKNGEDSPNKRCIEVETNRNSMESNVAIPNPLANISKWKSRMSRATITFSRM